LRAPELTLFMLVTPRDVVLADYAVRGYRKLVGRADFQVLVYSNYLLPEQKQFYFPRWQRLPFVRIQRNDHHDADVEAIKVRVGAERLEGPFEYCDPIWDRELPLQDSPLVATVDADFELLRPGFVSHMLGAFRDEPRLIGFSTDYSPRRVHFESFTGEQIILNERNHTWFCIYRREAFSLAGTSHAYHQEIRPDQEIRRDAWDSSAYFQKALRDQGRVFRHLDPSFRHQYIHYGAFSKNTTVTRHTVGVFRAFALLEHQLPARPAAALRLVRTRVLPRLENNRNQWVREAPIRW
jgi:hypothetical protein